MRISDWSSDVCSSDLFRRCHDTEPLHKSPTRFAGRPDCRHSWHRRIGANARPGTSTRKAHEPSSWVLRSEEHTSELQSLMRISYAVFCLKKKNKNQYKKNRTQSHTKTHRHLNTKITSKKVNTP